METHPTAGRSPWLLRRGTAEAPPHRLRAQAGALAVEVVDGVVEAVRPYGATLTSLYGAVRDRNWSTVPGVLSAVECQASDDAFRVAFHCVHREGDVHFEWDGTVEGRADGSLEVAMDGRARSAFLRSRIGLCVLLSDRAARLGFGVSHTDGRRSAVAPFPLVRPWQPARGIRALHVADGPCAYTLEFEGDVFEMEDERNWSDAGLKVYGTPLALPYPVMAQPGDVVRQRVRLTPARAMRRRARSPVEAPTGAAGRPLCAVGVRLAPGAEAPAPVQVERLRQLGLAHVRVDLDLAGDDWQRALRSAAATARASGCALEVAPIVPARGAGRLLRDADTAARDLGVPVARWLVHGQSARVTPPALARTALDALARPDGAPVGFGADASFAELNRTRARWLGAHFLYCAANPQGHLRADEALLRNARGLAWVADTMRARLPGGGAAISPLTLQRVLNAAATDGSAGPPPPDPRIASLIGACWLVASLQQCAGKLDALTVLEAAGPRGVMAADGSVYPLYHVLADVCAMEGAAVAAGADVPHGVALLDLRQRARRRVLAANLAPARVQVALPGVPARAVRYLDEATAPEAMRSPEAWRGGPGIEGPLPGPDARLDLLPYAVATIDCREEA